MHNRCLLTDSGHRIDSAQMDDQKHDALCRLMLVEWWRHYEHTLSTLQITYFAFNQSMDEQYNQNTSINLIQ